jgi:D-threo-aldose 1-dehydrogenase
MSGDDAHRTIPRTGQSLTTLGLGCAALAGLFDAVPAAQARATVDAAWDAGVRLFDTAPFYGYTLSEHRVGEALRERPRDDFMLSSKVGRVMQPLPPRAEIGAARPRGDAWVGALPFVPRFDYRAGALRRSVEDSLQRLGMCRLDIALIHDIGEATHGDDNAQHWQALVGGGFRELEAMQREGLIGAIGLGVNECAVVLAALEHIALDCCLLAGRYTLLEQAALHPFLDMARQREMAVIVGGPFNSGVLAASDPAQGHFDYGRVPPDVLERVHGLARVCAAHEVALPAAALQFPLAHPAVVAVIPGARSAAEFEQIAAWWHARLPESLWNELRDQGLIAADAPVPT